MLGKSTRSRPNLRNNRANLLTTVAGLHGGEAKRRVRGLFGKFRYQRRTMTLLQARTSDACPPLEYDRLLLTIVARSSPHMATQTSRTNSAILLLFFSPAGALVSSPPHDRHLPLQISVSICTLRQVLSSVLITVCRSHATSANANCGPAPGRPPIDASVGSAFRPTT